MILKCNCVNKGQDKLHGKGMRAHNKMQKTKSNKTEYKCTVCLAIR